MPLLVVAWASVAGCGQKGPLFLPDDPSAIQSTIPESPGGEGSADTDEDEAGAGNADPRPEDEPS